jgi:peptidoglycan/xylan/chitin deacetylase (PgdA/CDA1 family)
MMTLDLGRDGRGLTGDYPAQCLNGPIRNRSGSALFLCYHSVCDDGPPFLSIPTRTFEEQLAALRRAGYHTGAHRQLVELAGGGPSQRRVAFLTFDDGWEDNFSCALPILREYGATALIFVLPDYVSSGRAFDWPEIEDVRRAFPGVAKPLTWEKVDQLADAGIEFGSHTMTHRAMTALSDEELMQELLDSRRKIESRVGRCDSIAYPFGYGDQRIARAAAAAGYSFGFTAPVGYQRQVTRMTIPRIPVDQRDAGRRWAMKLNPITRRLWLSRVHSVVHRDRPTHA